MYQPDAFQHRYAYINGLRYHYVDEGVSKKFVLLIHGWPDLWYGYRYQIVDLKKTYRIICPDLVGFGETDKPDGRESLNRYTFKSVCTDLVQLMQHVGAPHFDVIGHDWGGMVAWRMAQYFPENVLSLVSICTAFQQTHQEVIPLDVLIEKLPNLSYQKVLLDFETDHELDRNVNDFFDTMFQTESNPFTSQNEFIKSFIPKNKLSNLQDMSFHKKMYKTGGFHGGLNWYRTRELNHYDETQFKIGRVACPSMLVIATRDVYLIPSMAKHVQKHVPQCHFETIAATHWVMIEKPNEINSLLLNWLEKQNKSKL
jgi:soluble epoxide hydrolase / lipid-phosphate phosphatase